MLLLYSPGSAGRCPHRLMSVEMVVRRRRRDTPDCDQIPLLLLPSLLTPALQRILPATGPWPTPGTGHITESLTHPGPLSLSWQQNIRKVLQLLRTEERFSAARIFPVLTVLSPDIIRNLTTARQTADSANSKPRLLLGTFYLCLPDAAQFLPRPMVRCWILSILAPRIIVRVWGSESLVIASHVTAGHNPRNVHNWFYWWTITARDGGK